MRISIPILLIVGVLSLSIPGVGEGRGVTVLVFCTAKEITEDTARVVVDGTASKHAVGLSLGGCGK